MAGYFLYSFNYKVFTQLVTTPTREQAVALADCILENIENHLCYFNNGADANIWPRDREALSNVILERLVRPDWYSDLSLPNALIWDNVIYCLNGETGETIGIDFDVFDFESIYWDCAETATEFGATMMDESKFGGCGFRYFGNPKDPNEPWPMYSIHMPKESQELLIQLEAVEPKFKALPDGEEFSPREQFFEALLPFVREMVDKNRVIYISTDT